MQPVRPRRTTTRSASWLCAVARLAPQRGVPRGALPKSGGQVMANNNIQKAGPHHIIRIRSKRGNGEIVLIRGGRQAYLWAGPTAGSPRMDVYTLSGEKTLRALAYAILGEVGNK